MPGMFPANVTRNRRAVYLSGHVQLAGSRDLLTVHRAVCARVGSNLTCLREGPGGPHTQRRPTTGSASGTGRRYSTNGCQWHAMA
jgi:hypothetical protein